MNDNESMINIEFCFTYILVRFFNGSVLTNLGGLT